MDAFYAQLGKLNADLVGAEFSDQAPTSEQLAILLRTARALHAYARQQPVAQEWRQEEEEKESGEAEEAVKDTPCVGPCLHLWRGANTDADVRALVAAMQQTTSPCDARTLYCQLLKIKPENAVDVETYTLCFLTGFPCCVFSDALLPCATVAPSRTSPRSAWQEAVRESEMLVQYAEHVAHSRILLLEAGAASAAVPLSGGRESGAGAAHRQLVESCKLVLSGGHGVDAITSFYRYQPDLKHASVRAAIAQFEHLAAQSKGDALDYLVSGAVVDPLVLKSGTLSRPDVRAALKSQWHAYVSRVAADFSVV